MEYEEYDVGENNLKSKTYLNRTIIYCLAEELTTHPPHNYQQNRISCDETKSHQEI